MYSKRMGLTRLPGLILVLAVFPAALPGAAQTAGQHRCASALQGKVAWNYSGDKRWSPEKIARLCKGAENSAQPARCFRKVMHGGVNWGGGTRWQFRNAAGLCRGAKNADARISCFRKKVAGRTGWRQAIRECGGPGALTMPGTLRKRLQPDAGKLRKPPPDKSSPLDKDSGSVRFGDGEHGRRPSTQRDGTDVKPGAGPSGGIADRPSREGALGSRRTDALPPRASKKEGLRLEPRVTGYRPSTVMQGGEVTVTGHMFGDSKGGRRLVLGLNANPDHSLARNLTPRAWTESEIRTRVPDDVLPAKYFIAIADTDGKWVTNRLRSLRVLGRQKVSVKAVVMLRCYADVLRRPGKLRVTLEPVRAADMGMERGRKISIPVSYNGISPGKFGSRLYAYTATAEVPHGLFEIDMERPEGAASFKAKDWSRTEGAPAYHASKPCSARRRVHPETGKPLKDPPEYVFRISHHANTVRIGPRTRTLELSGQALADPSELGALPPPTPVDE
ncbi:MAG: hypothetical protein ACLFWF_10350 [Alphaproteobacteria bacterium]